MLSLGSEALSVYETLTAPQFVRVLMVHKLRALAKTCAFNI